MLEKSFNSNQMNKVIWHFVVNYYIRMWTWRKQSLPWQFPDNRRTHINSDTITNTDLNSAIVPNVYTEKQFNKRQNVLVYTWTSLMNMLSARIYPSESAIKIHVRPLRLLYTSTGMTKTIDFFCIFDSKPIII